MNKFTVISGINDFGGQDLNGCLNDTQTIANITPGWDHVILKDREVTQENLFGRIRQMFDLAKEGDEGFIWHSGHGTQVPGGDEPDYYDEGIVVWNSKGTGLDVIIDDDYRALLDEKPDYFKLTVGLDTCFSGGMIRAMFLGKVFKNVYKKERFINLYDTYPLMKSNKPFLKVEQPKFNLLCASQEGQPSLDVYSEGKYQGAFTWALSKGIIIDGYTPNALFHNAVINIESKGYDQDPEIYGIPKNLDTVIGDYNVPDPEPKPKKEWWKWIISGIVIALGSVIYFLI